MSHFNVATRQALRVFAAGAIVATGVAILALGTSENTASNRDYISYWAAGQQLARHANPYDQQAVLAMERSVGYDGSRPLVMRNPPPSLVLAVPLGFVGARTGAALWSLALIVSLIASIRMLWIMQGQPNDRLHLVGYIFPPAMACLLAGQVGILLLLGIVLFLYFLESRPYVSGAALVMCSMKPHLFLPFGVALAVWVFSRRAYMVAAGMAMCLAVTLGFSYLIDPRAWAEYSHLAATAGLAGEFVPTTSTAFRMALDRDAIWLQLLPALIACAWTARWSWDRRNSWSWRREGSLLLAVSVMVAPYAWFTDEAVLLPAILFGLYRASDAGCSLVPYACITGIALLEVMAGVPLNSGFYIWTMPAWLLWCLYTNRNGVEDAVLTTSGASTMT